MSDDVIESESLISRILKSGPAKIGIGIVIAILAFILIGPFIVPYSPQAIAGPANSPPSLAHPFGTDYLGHDLLSQVVYGGYPTLVVGVISAFGASGIGFVAGLFAGYYKKLDPIISGGVDVILSLPAVVFLILLGSLFLATNTIIAIGLVVVLWASLARAVRAQVLSVKKLAYVEAAKTSGMTDLKTLIRIIAPAVAPIAVSYFVLSVSVSIVIAASVEFLGVGNLTQVSWGSILYFAQLYGFFVGDWWWIMAPGLLLALVSTGFALVGFSLEEILNPRLRVR